MENTKGIARTGEMPCKHTGNALRTFSFGLIDWPVFFDQLLGEGMYRRTFNGQTDLDEMQRIVMERTRVMGPCTNLHPGDIAHRIYSGSRMQNLDEVVPVYVHDDGVAGFGIIWPQDRAFDVVTRVGLSAHTVADVVEDLAGMAGREQEVETDVIGDDQEMTGILTSLGFTRGGAEYVFTQAPLNAPIPAEPTGFVIRSASHGDADQLALVHSGAFASGWSLANYAARMRKPGYDPHNEMVAVHEDGTFMGFAMTWYDEMNNVGYFEPVGVHRDFRRRGVGSALLRAGMIRMRDAGMTSATVWHASAEDRAVAFYQSNGFASRNPVARWQRGHPRRISVM
jgi:mycothiol synthase